MTYLPIFFAVAGIFIGLIYISYAWGERRPEKSELRDDPRIKGLIWCISGLTLIFIADWQKLFRNVSGVSPENINVSEFIGFYLGGFAVGAASSLFMLILKVAFQAYQVSRRFDQPFLHSGISPTIEFFLHGYRAFQQAIAAETQRHTTQKAKEHSLEENIQKLQRRLSAERAWPGRVNSVFVTAFHGYKGYLSKKDDAASACETILSSVALAAAYYTKLESRAIRCSYMTVQERSNLAGRDIAAAKFMFLDTSRYKHFLLVAGYSGRGTQVIRLPIEPEETKDLTLPGAPEAFVKGSPVVFIVDQPKFAPGVPKSIQEAQIAYFKSQGFSAIASFPIRRTQGHTSRTPPVGVINIDLTFDTNLLKSLNTVEILDQFGAHIQPFMMLLGDILTSELAKGRIL